MSSPLSGALAVALLALAAAPALAQGDAAKGEKVFKKCLACHAIAPDAPKTPGPNLHDVVGRQTGTFPDFQYSEAMAKLGAEGHVWTPEEIEKFLADPKGMVPGTKMTFAGLKKPEERADVVAYLITLHPEGAAAAAPAAEPTPAP